MLLVLGIATSMMGHANPAFHVNYEVESVSLETGDDVPVYHRVTQRFESNDQGTLARVVIKRDGTATVILFSGKTVTFEAIAPDGTRHSMTKKMPVSLATFSDAAK